MSNNKSFQGPGSRTRRKMSGERQQALNKNKCKELIGDMLISDGHREMLKRLVQSRLAQSGWTYAMRTKYIDYIKQKGVENVNVSHMIAETVPKGVETFPEPLRLEIEDLLWGFSTEFISVDENSSLPPTTENEGGMGYSDFCNYQNRDAKPEPGIGYNVPTPEIALSRTPSPSIPHRPLTPIPILRPENIKNEIKDEAACQDDEDEEDLSSNMDENDEDDVDEMEDAEDNDDDDDDEQLNPHVPNHNVESEEEELMDV